MVGLADTDWLAGFVDGEGCFTISRRSRQGIYSPEFVINLRDDDAGILKECQKTFGGYTYATNRTAPKAKGHPQFAWRVSSKKNLQTLVAYFDAHPLRAIKARDYDPWRRAVQVYVECGGKHSYLPVLRDELRSGREYQ